MDAAELRYTTMEKLALTVVTSARKLRPYFQSHTIDVLTNQPLRAILHSPSQSGRMTRWAIELSEYDINYKGRTAAKSQVLADFIVEIPPSAKYDELNPHDVEHSEPSVPLEIVPYDNSIQTSIVRRDEPEASSSMDNMIVEKTKNSEEGEQNKTGAWTLFVDGSSSQNGAGIGIRLKSPEGGIFEQSFRLNFTASNNEAEYEALIAGLRLARGMNVQSICAFCDSQLVTSQFSGEYEARNDRMEAYLKVTKELAGRFETFELTKIPRGDNAQADALAALASTSDPRFRRTIPVDSIDEPNIKAPTIIPPKQSQTVYIINGPAPKGTVDHGKTDRRNEIRESKRRRFKTLSGNTSFAVTVSPTK